MKDLRETILSLDPESMVDFRHKAGEAPTASVKAKDVQALIRDAEKDDDQD